MNIEAPTLSEIRRMSTKKLRAYLELVDWNDEVASDEFNERCADAQFDDQQMAGMYDAPELSHCDDWGTGEGRWHGRM